MADLLRDDSPAARRDRLARENASARAAVEAVVAYETSTARPLAPPEDERPGWVPAGSYCACGRVVSECDGSRARCVNRPPRTLRDHMLPTRPASDAPEGRDLREHRPPRRAVEDVEPLGWDLPPTCGARP